MSQSHLILDASTFHLHLSIVRGAAEPRPPTACGVERIRA